MNAFVQEEEEQYRHSKVLRRMCCSQVFARGQDEEHRGLTPGFLAGVKHQELVRGRAPRHRGLYLGRVATVTRQGVRLELAGPVKRGDGVVFDFGDPEAKEEGGKVCGGLERAGAGAGGAGGVMGG
jgi:putative protease